VLSRNAPRIPGSDGTLAKMNAVGGNFPCKLGQPIDNQRCADSLSDHPELVGK
jgi:hypothetical protein